MIDFSPTPTTTVETPRSCLSHVGLAPTADPRLEAEVLSLGYDDRLIVDSLSVSIPTGQITIIVGANACGKSTLLRGLARLLKPRQGTVLLDGESIQSRSTRDVATQLGILPQQPIAPEGLTVGDLVGRGRHPHQKWFRQWTPEDEDAVQEALRSTNMEDLADRCVDELSGGQRQRAWIAMALAQGTPIVLLDEPTTFLDLAHQADVMDLLDELNRRDARTIVVVLHDLNQACRYAHRIVAMKDGQIVAEGRPADVITEELVHQVFGLHARIIPDPITGTPLVIPIPKAHR